MCGHDLTAGDVFATRDTQGAADQASVSWTSEVGSEKAQRMAPFMTPSKGSKSHLCASLSERWTGRSTALRPQCPDRNGQCGHHSCKGLSEPDSPPGHSGRAEPR